jgi:colicin import membrane protein
MAALPLSPHRAPRRGESRLGALLLTLLAHSAFFALLVFGVQWQTRPRQPFQAEIWRTLPVPAPAPAPPEPAPLPAPAPQPVTEAPPPPQAVADPRAEIQLREEEERKRKEAERAAQAQRAREAAQQRQREQAAQQKAQAEKALREKIAREQVEKAAKARAEAAERARLKAEADARAKAEADARAQQQARIGVYINRIREKVRGRANVPDSVTGRPKAVFRVVVLPTGDVLSVTLVRGSGNPVYDTALERGIRAAQPLPIPRDAPELMALFRELTLDFEHDR